MKIFVKSRVNMCWKLRMKRASGRPMKLRLARVDMRPIAPTSPGIKLVLVKDVNVPIINKIIT